MEKKKVVYNGGTRSFYTCSNPKVLEIGRIYEVVSETSRQFAQGAQQTDYALKGIFGKFDSTWFDDIFSEMAIMATSNEIPVKGDQYVCRMLESNEKIFTPPVIDVHVVGENVYKVTTRDALYVVTVTTK